MKEFLSLDSLEDAVIGHCHTWRETGIETILVYSAEQIVDILTDRDGMTVEDAEEWISVNIEGAYMGPTTPIVVWAMREWDDYE
jgi:hypothetical protein